MALRKVQNWRAVLKGAWVNWILYGMIVVQVVDIARQVLTDDVTLTSTGKDAMLTVLAGVGVWVRVLYQVSLQANALRRPPAETDKGEPDE